MKPYIVVFGPTSSGKSSLAMQIAEYIEKHSGHSGELINGDSIQLYRGFDIGSAKPSNSDQSKVPHHLFDLLSPHENMDASRYCELAHKKVLEIQERKRIPIVVGGSGLYLRALWLHDFHDLPSDQNLRKKLQELTTEELWKKLLNLDPKRADQLHPNDRFRVVRALELSTLLGQPISGFWEENPREASEWETQAIKVYLCPQKEQLLRNIEVRTQNMIDQGLINEVEDLIKSGVSKECTPMQSIGYSQVVSYLNGEKRREDLLELIIFATRQYAKRQNTWFRKSPVDFLIKDNSSKSLSDLLSSSLEKLKFS